MPTRAKPASGDKAGESREPNPILVHCSMRLPRREADALLSGLPIPFDCGSASIRKTKAYVEVEADLEIRTIGDIVGKGIPVLVTKRIPIKPVPARELISDAAAWFKQIDKLG